MLRKGTLSLGLSVAFGSLIGTVIALDISERFASGSWFWALGALLGGVIAWIVVDFDHFRSSVTRAYCEIADWEPDHLYWKALGAILVGFSSVFLSGFAIAAIGSHYDAKILLLFGYGMMYLMPICLISALFDVLVSDSENHSKFKEMIGVGTKMMMFGNPVVLPFTALYAVGLLAYKTYLIAPDVIRAMWQIAVTSFLYAHTERRRICFVDAVIGSTIGYFCGSAIIGAATGALLGMVDYELVSRWLKLVPART